MGAPVPTPRTASEHLWVYASVARDLFIAAAFPFLLAVLVAVMGVLVTPPENLVIAYGSGGLLCAIGLVLLLFGILSYRKIQRLLTRGTIVPGQITDCQRRVPWYAKYQRTRSYVTYQYDSAQGPQQSRFSVWSHNADYAWLRAGLAIRVVFDPERVGSSFVLLPHDETPS